MKAKFVFVWLLISVVSCQNPKDTKYRKQFDTVHDLLTAMARMDSISVRRMIGVENLRDIGDDSTLLRFKVEHVSELIKKYGLPDEDKYTSKEYSPTNYRLLDVIIPIFKGNNTDSIEGKITVKFVKYLPPEEILDFEVEGNYTMKLIEPLTDSAELK